MLAEIGKTPEDGVQRIALTGEDREAQELVSSWMREADMTVANDQFGNLIGRKAGSDSKAPSVMIGSHIDTVPNGGRFDGTIGVIGGVEVVQAIHEAGIPHRHTIEVVAFCDEEGARFQSGLFGSRAIVGNIRPQELQRTDQNGVSRYTALRSFGLNPDDIVRSIRKAGDLKVYLEMHIEQGPYLQSIGEPVGIVTGIAAPTWLRIKLIGEAGHAGTVPMHLRRDPMCGAAEAISAIEKLCAGDGTKPTVGTVGKIMVKPGGVNVIPSTVEFTADIRDIELSRRVKVVSQIIGVVNEISARRGLQNEVEEILHSTPMHCASHVIETMETYSRKIGLTPPKMISGAGHDAMMLAEITDIGMIFVRCRDGISHSPKEWASIEDIMKGTELLFETTLAYARQ